MDIFQAWKNLWTYWSEERKRIRRISSLASDIEQQNQKLTKQLDNVLILMKKRSHKQPLDVEKVRATLQVIAEAERPEFDILREFDQLLTEFKNYNDGCLAQAREERGKVDHYITVIERIERLKHVHLPDVIADLRAYATKLNEDITTSASLEAEIQLLKGLRASIENYLSNTMMNHIYKAREHLLNGEHDKAEIIIHSLWRQHFKDRMPVWNQQLSEIIKKVLSLVDLKRKQVRTIRQVSKESLREVMKKIKVYPEMTPSS